MLGFLFLATAKKVGMAWMVSEKAFIFAADFKVGQVHSAARDFFEARCRGTPCGRGDWCCENWAFVCFVCRPPTPKGEYMTENFNFICDICPIGLRTILSTFKKLTKFLRDH